jgi:adenosylcobinamide kinase / adenosylcobinamide-phosphate guanylyltransferase
MSAAFDHHLTLVTGPARSGKSEWAEHCAEASGKTVCYIATGQENPTDPEWQARIQQHRDRRPASWRTLQVAIDLPAAIATATSIDCLIVDSLGTWVANLMERDPTDWQQRSECLLRQLQTTQSQVILVAEETGWGVVPAYPLGRSFRDRLGQLVRQVGGLANPVYLVTGGYVLNLTELGRPLPPLKP